MQAAATVVLLLVCILALSGASNTLTSSTNNDSCIVNGGTCGSGLVQTGSLRQKKLPSSESSASHLPSGNYISSAQVDTSQASYQAALSLMSKLGGRTTYTKQEEQRLAAIINGNVSKSELEVVMAQHDENTSWSESLKHVRTVYCKGSQVEDCIPLANVGREGHSYLHHIVNNYDNLSQWTVFTQAGEPSVGYAGHRMGGGHMLNGFGFVDYLINAEDLNDDNQSFFVFTGAINLGTMHHYMRHGYEIPDSSMFFRSKCPAEFEAELAENDYMTGRSLGSNAWVYWPLGRLLDMLAGRCSIPVQEINHMVLTYWSMLDLPVPGSGMIFFPQGARFAASRERIRQRPKKDYELLLELVSRDEDPCANYLNEWLWYHIIGKPQSIGCDASAFKSSTALSVSVTEEVKQHFNWYFQNSTSSTI